jgi:hypothetical protein
MESDSIVTDIVTISHATPYILIMRALLASHAEINHCAR